MFSEYFYRKTAKEHVSTKQLNFYDLKQFLKANMCLTVCTVHSAYFKKVKLLKKDLSPLTSHSDKNGLNRLLHIILGLR